MGNAGIPLNKEQIAAIKASISKRASELDAVFMNMLIESVPVIQSADALKKSVDEIVGCINSDQFELAADLGYRDLSSNFVWLQRSLGGVKIAALECSQAISDVAGDCGLAFEQVKPFVDQFFQQVRGSKHTP